MPRAAWLLPVLLLAACGAPNSGLPRFDTPTLSPPRPGDPATNPAVVQACRVQVAQELQRQDRGMLLREDESTSRLGAGFGGQPSTNQTDVLARQYLFERRINECIRLNTRTDPSVQPAPAATPAATPAPTPPRRGSRSGS
ncbi:hypothetical protein [Sediminicoccus rosea]|jgi:hypothetical protein|uniref:Lipoprotein n=1 Tax=Sediminicoccus rosea TaxID=1225128 RepID=A0ABZ0PCZ6_9PROT|nr:hypothetical protein [Sediminicoccus rosea]WPB83396.1 hypothetical protein R9Z33_14935 [Sediminicoccus rosea]